MTRIAVAGATGRVGRHVVDVLHEGGHDVVAISRANGVDVITGAGLAAALAGVEVVIDTSTGPSAEQGLLIARDHYERLGGYRPDSRRSETRLLRQLGRSSRTQLRSRIMVVA